MGKREYNEARNRATQKYQAARTRLHLVIDNEDADAWKAAAVSQGVSLTQFIRDAVNSYLEFKR